MLVLERKPGERILIGETVVITLLRCTGNTARIGIEAPQEIKIHRGEVPNEKMAKQMGQVK
jgi:carbon storage regulator